MKKKSDSPGHPKHRGPALTFWPAFCLLLIAIFVAYRYVNPAPPKHLVISAGNGEGDYLDFAKQYQELLKDDGITLEIRTSAGGLDNLKKLDDPSSDVEVGFVQDGLGSAEKSPDLSSLGSLYYEPIWVFSHVKAGEITRFSEYAGKTIAVGEAGSGTRVLALKLLKASGVTEANSKLLPIGGEEAEAALDAGKVDAAVFVGTAENPVVERLLRNPHQRLMSVDQAEAYARQFPFLHHLVLPHGAINLATNLPKRDIDLVAPTATLVVRDTLHPALAYLLLKAASEIHSEPGILEHKGEFPVDKDYQFPLSSEAKAYYKSGTPFWQRYLPFWLATLVERFIVLVIPVLALVLPMVRAVPRFYQWRIRRRIYARYGELKFLETQLNPGEGNDRVNDSLKRLDGIEERVNHMKVPLEFSDHIFALRQNIDFVRGRLRRALES
jgi:TRAP transporter TAXI family solute receptor